MKTKLVYISGGDAFSPGEIKTALDEIRQTLGLSNDVVLFGLPVDSLAEEVEVGIVMPKKAKTAVPEHKILQFPEIRRNSILNILGNPARADVAEEKQMISDENLVVEDEDDDTGDGDQSSITALFDGLPPLGEDVPPTPLPAKNLADEFGEYLDKEEEKPVPVPKKARPFGRKAKNLFNNGWDLFNFSGGAANDDAEDFKLPDFIKRP